MHQYDLGRRACGSEALSIYCDSDCDLEDFWAFQACFDSSPVCGWAAADASGGVDLDDFAILSPGGVEGSSVYGTSRRWSGCVRRRLS